MFATFFNVFYTFSRQIGIIVLTANVKSKKKQSLLHQFKNKLLPLQPKLIHFTK